MVSSESVNTTISEMTDPPQMTVKHLLHATVKRVEILLVQCLLLFSISSGA
jgi:hypothetical protein